MENRVKGLNSVNGQSVLLQVATFFRYFADAFFYVYLSRLLLAKGFTESKIGILLSITPIVALICNPIWNILGKNTEVCRKIFKYLTVIEGILIIFYTRVTGFALLAVFTGLLSVVASPFYNYLDSFCQNFAVKNNRDYVAYRIMGSSGYVAATIIGGVVSHFFGGYDIICMIGGLMMFLCCIPFALIRPINTTIDDNQEEVKRDYKALFSNKRFWIHVIVYFFMISISQVGDSYISTYLERVHNIESLQFGFIAGAMYLFELVLLLLLLKFGQKLNRHITFILAGVFFFLRSACLYFNLPAPVQICAVVLRGAAWALLVFSNMSIITDIVKVENVTPALFIITIGTLVLQSIGNFTFGKMIEVIGYSNLYGIISISVLIAIILKSLSYTYYSRKKSKNNG